MELHATSRDLRLDAMPFSIEMSSYVTPCKPCAPAGFWGCVRPAFVALDAALDNDLRIRNEVLPD